MKPLPPTTAIRCGEWDAVPRVNACSSGDILVSLAVADSLLAGRALRLLPVAYAARRGRWVSSVRRGSGAAGFGATVALLRNNRR